MKIQEIKDLIYAAERMQALIKRLEIGKGIKAAHREAQVVGLTVEDCAIVHAVLTQAILQIEDRFK